MSMFIRYATTLKIAKRLFFAAALSAIVPGIVISILGLSSINTLTKVNSTVETTSSAVNLTRDQEAYLLRMNALLGGVSNNTTYNSDFIVQTSTEISGLTEDMDRAVVEYQLDYQINASDNMQDIHDTLNSNSAGQNISTTQQNLISLVNQRWNTYKEIQNKVIDDLQGRLSPGTDTQQADTQYVPLKNSVDNLVDLTEQLSQVILQDNVARIPFLITITIIAFIFSIVFVSLIGYLVSLTITRPLHRLVDLTTRIARGDTEARAKPVGQDEIALVAVSMNMMLDNIVQLMQNEKKLHEQLRAQVDKMIDEVRVIATGDLNVQAVVTDDALGIVARFFNHAIHELGGLVMRVKIVSNEVKNLTKTTFEHMSHLVNIGDLQYQHIESSSAEVKHMATSTQQIANRAQMLYHKAMETNQTAQSGRAAVQKAAYGMGRVAENVQSTSLKVQVLRESSQEINNIIKVISHITYQTNRLSLDASVQAAMAGDNGKGFAAIATDIRHLAELAKEQTNMIETLVRRVSENIANVGLSMRDTEHETSEGLRLTKHAGEALETIFNAIEWQAQEIEDINKMAIKQTNASSMVVRTMLSASDLTQHSSSETHEAAKKMAHLATLVEQLYGSVETFKVSKDKHRTGNSSPALNREKGAITPRVLQN